MRPLPKAPEIGRIEPESSRFYHVRDHLLNDPERWDLACPTLDRNARARALRCGCSGPVLETRAWRFELASEDCKRALAGLHDAHYEPTYRRELESAQANGFYAFGYGTGKLEAVGDTGVYITAVWSKVPVGWRVYTALRRDYSGSTIATDNRIFFDRAVRRWREKTSKPGGRSP